jgi:DNA-binding HxlR family transcriptional regulator
MPQDNQLEPPLPIEPPQRSACDAHTSGSVIGICPMDAVLKLLMGPWTTYIVWLLETQGANASDLIKSFDRAPAPP